MALFLRGLCAGALLLAGLGSALAQSNPLFIRLTPASAALYKPDSGPAPHVGLIIIHRTANYLAHPGCTEFSRRGFMVLCFNTCTTAWRKLWAVCFARVACDCCRRHCC